MKIYIVTAYRWGERNNHSYNIGVFSSIKKARDCAESHVQYRGGKYSCTIEEGLLDEYDEEGNYMVEVFRYKGREGV